MSFGEMVTTAATWASGSALKSEFAGAVALALLGFLGGSVYKQVVAGNNITAFNGATMGLVGISVGIIGGFAHHSWNQFDAYNFGGSALCAGILLYTAYWANEDKKRKNERSAAGAPALKIAPFEIVGTLVVGLGIIAGTAACAGVRVVASCARG